MFPACLQLPVVQIYGTHLLNYINYTDYYSVAIFHMFVCSFCSYYLVWDKVHLSFEYKILFVNYNYLQRYLHCRFEHSARIRQNKTQRRIKTARCEININGNYLTLFRSLSAFINARNLIINNTSPVFAFSFCFCINFTWTIQNVLLFCCCSHVSRRCLHM